MRGARGDGGQRGLTLIEVMLAMLLLSFGLLAIAPLFSGSVKTGASSNQLASSNTLAREKLEEVIGYPATDARLLVPAGMNAAGPAGLTTTGIDSVVGHNPSCDNDLPSWYNPSTGGISTAAASPGAGWYLYPFQRTYTIEQFDGDLTTRVTAPGAYVAKKVTVTVRATTGPFPGLRQTRQSVFVGYRDGS
ncbi:MAG TPA: prepilin-type N-terminal cleavage/methylation domain-containing protein [Thermoanaerobaculia bacterium]